MNRRQWMNRAALGSIATLAGASNSREQLPASAAQPDYTIQHGAIRQSIMGWTFRDRMEMLELAKLCKDIGLVAIEGIPRDLYPEVKGLGLDISLVSSHGFAKGPCNPEFRNAAVADLHEAIDVAVEVGCPSVITFTGMTYPGMNETDAAQSCVDAWKEVMPKAEEKGIDLVLEHLNSRDDTHPMKGHPGYFGDDVDFCVDLIRKVDSPRMKLLFDIYHVSVMNGDIIRRIRQYQDLIGHYHTAGNPGRGELDDRQEVNYPVIMETILETAYTGYVAQEFIPTWENAELALRHAAMLCDVPHP
ncbi:MAG: TIM barrel protein [Verrucomicrobiota bacterium]